MFQVLEKATDQMGEWFKVSTCLSTHEQTSMECITTGAWHKPKNVDEEWVHSTCLMLREGFSLTRRNKLPAAIQVNIGEAVRECEALQGYPGFCEPSPSDTSHFSSSNSSDSSSSE